MSHNNGWIAPIPCFCNFSSSLSAKQWDALGTPLEQPSKVGTMTISEELVESGFGLVPSSLPTAPRPLHINLSTACATRWFPFFTKHHRSHCYRGMLTTRSPICDTEHLRGIENLGRESPKRLQAHTERYIRCNIRIHRLSKHLPAARISTHPSSRTSSACSFRAPDQSQVTRLHCTHEC